MTHDFYSKTASVVHNSWLMKWEGEDHSDKLDGGPHLDDVLCVGLTLIQRWTCGKMSTLNPLLSVNRMGLPSLVGMMIGQVPSHFRSGQSFVLAYSSPHSGLIFKPRPNAPAYQQNRISDEIAPGFLLAQTNNDFYVSIDSDGWRQLVWAQRLNIVRMGWVQNLNVCKLEPSPFKLLAVATAMGSSLSVNMPICLSCHHPWGNVGLPSNGCNTFPLSTSKQTWQHLYGYLPKVGGDGFHFSNKRNPADFLTFAFKILHLALDGS